MADRPAYVILGRGRWAARIHAILLAEGCRVAGIPETRRTDVETDEIYRSRLATAMAAAGAQIAWLCVLPGPHVPLMIDVALDAGLHVVVEKPWQSSRLVTELLTAKAKSLHRVIAVHFEYCLLEEVEQWRRDFHLGEGLRFGGRFFLSRSDHTGMRAIDNLGSHLLAIREYAAPKAALQEICCGYEQPDQRCVWLERRNTQAAFIDLLANREPIIQRFITKVEASLDGAHFPFGLEFSGRVAREITNLQLDSASTSDS